MSKRALELHPEVNRIRKALRSAITTSGHTMAELSEELGISLYSILGEYQFLRVEHVFIVLDYLRIDPAEFFADVYRRTSSAPPADDRVAGMSRREIEDHIRRVAMEVVDQRFRSEEGGGRE